MISAAFRNAIVILSSQDSACQGRPDGGSELASLEESSVFDLHVLSLQNVVLGLFDHWLDQTELLTNHQSLSYVVLFPLTCSPIEGPALANHPIESFTDLLHWDCVVASVAVDHIDVVVVQIFERLPHALDDVLAREAFESGVTGKGTIVDFGRQDEVMPGHSKGFECFPELSFSFP